jgi:hypothetical protein
MSSRRCRILIATLLAAPPLVGQTMGELRARSDSLAREWRQANALADLQDTLRYMARRSGRDTIRVGALTILANDSPLPLQEAAAKAWPAIERLYGPAAQIIAEHPIVIQAVDPDTAVDRPPIGEGLHVAWNLSVRELSRLLESRVDFGPTDPALREWLGGSLLLRGDAAPRRSKVYVQLVTAPSLAVRRCFLGAVAACREALSLSDTPDILTRWYDAAERRALAMRMFHFSPGPRQTMVRSCGVGNDSACLDLLESSPPGTIIRPLDYEARVTLVELALQMGGRDAFLRLVDAKPRSVVDRLVAVAGVGMDSLVTRWLGQIRAARPVSTDVPLLGTWVALGWIGVFAAFGLRSSRWRVT